MRAPAPNIGSSDRRRLLKAFAVDPAVAGGQETWTAIKSAIDQYAARYFGSTETTQSVANIKELARSTDAVIAALKKLGSRENKWLNLVISGLSEQSVGSVKDFYGK